MTSGGNDSNDGKSWGTAFATIEAANASLGTQPGVVYLGKGTHTPGSTLSLHGRRYIGATSYTGGGGYAQISHTFNGDLFSITGEQGGGIEGISLVNNGSNTGAAIRITSSAALPAGYLYFDRLICTGTTGFDNNVVINGSANSIGARSIFFRDCLFFGATSGTNVNVNKGIHVYFTACDIVQAPTATTQTLQIQDAASEDVFYTGKVLGDVSTAGAASLGGDVALCFVGSIKGNVTCETGSAKNVFLGSMSGTWGNSGSLTSNRAHVPWVTATLLNSWTTLSGNTPAYRLTPSGVQLKGAVTGGSSATAAIFNLPTQFRPANDKEFVISSNGAAANVKVTAATGSVAMTAGGSTTSAYLGGIPPIPPGE